MILPTRPIKSTKQMLSLFGLGSAPLGNLSHAVSDQDAFATIDAAWDAGIRYFDTAPFYGYGLAERRMGLALHNHVRAEYVISTKVGRLLAPLSQVGKAEFQPGGAWQNPPPFASIYDYSASGLRRSVEASLQRLGMDYLDIVFVHDIGEVTHGDKNAHYWSQLVSGGFRELEQLKREKLIGAIGLGVNEFSVISAAQEHIDLDCSMLAGRYSLLEQNSLAFMDQCALKGLGIILGGVFNSGILAADLNKRVTYNYVEAAPEVIAHAKKLHQLCNDFGVSLAAAAVQFPLAHPAVVSAALGARSVTQLQKTLDWANEAIPVELWLAFQDAGLIAFGAPLPNEKIK